MSEYIEVQVEETDEFDEIVLVTNLPLTPDGIEAYESVEAMAEGSALAQFLSTIPGIQALTIEDDSLTIQRDPTVAYHTVVEDVTAAIKEFFL
jgi:hypothetical protein